MISLAFYTYEEEIGLKILSTTKILHRLKTLKKRTKVLNYKLTVTVAICLVGSLQVYREPRWQGSATSYKFVQILRHIELI